MDAAPIHIHQVGDFIIDPATRQSAMITRFVASNHGRMAAIEFETGATGYVSLARLEAAPTEPCARGETAAGVHPPHPGRRPVLRLAAVDGRHV